MVFPLRLIPARAGNTDWFFTLTLTQAAHPRSRGEHYAGGIAVFLDGGSSPLARGTRAGTIAFQPDNRLIPARAGNTHQSQQSPSQSSAHPRSRGEHPAFSVIVSPTCGSSPLARGTRRITASESCYWRLIPARAGNTENQSACGSIHAAHPRSRGEHMDRYTTTTYGIGSSPLARGTPRASIGSRLQMRLIPARAGNTARHI